MKYFYDLIIFVKMKSFLTNCNFYKLDFLRTVIFTNCNFYQLQFQIATFTNRNIQITIFTNLEGFLINIQIFQFIYYLFISELWIVPLL